jgi:hypothetical protein
MVRGSLAVLLKRCLHSPPEGTVAQILARKEEFYQAVIGAGREEVAETDGVRGVGTQLGANPEAPTGHGNLSLMTRHLSG